VFSILLDLATRAFDGVRNLCKDQEGQNTDQSQTRNGQHGGVVLPGEEPVDRLSSCESLTIVDVAIDGTKDRQCFSVTADDDDVRDQKVDDGTNRGGGMHDARVDSSFRKAFALLHFVLVQDGPVDRDHNQV